MIKPIQTRYKGYHFRSRLEARWALFFDLIGANWLYEVEGFEIDGVRYLPDFRISFDESLTTWIEVKPDGVISDPKFTAFKTALEDDWNQSTLLISGDPLTHIGAEHTLCPRCLDRIGKAELDSCAQDEIWVMCHDCDLSTPSSSGHGEWPVAGGISARPHKGWMRYREVDFRRWVKLVNSSAQTAREHRF